MLYALAAVVCKILTLLADTYPWAIYYPFNVTYACLNLRAKDMLSSISFKLRNSSIETFIEALNGLTHPHLRYIDNVSQIQKEFNAKNLEKSQSLLSNLIADNLTETWIHVGRDIGSYNQKFAKNLKKEFDKLKISLNIRTVLNKDILTNLIKMKDSLDDETYASGSIPLSLFSEWLSKFDPKLHKLEMPGLYLNDFDREPNVKLHDQIIGIDQSLLVMSSIRKPKRIIFYGTSGRLVRIFLYIACLFHSTYHYLPVLI